MSTIVPLPDARIPLSVLVRLTHDDIVDTRQYRYRIHDRRVVLRFVEYCETVVERIARQYLDKTVALDPDNWEIVALVDHK